MKEHQEKQEDKEYVRFEFPGFGSQGTCFLRARIRPSGMVILCSQLLNYHGTSITNATEQILLSAIDRLNKDVGLERLYPPKPWWQIWRNHNIVVEHVVRRTMWVEHYPAGTGLLDNESFALVAFDSNLHPIWNYVSKEEAARECGVEAEFLEVDAEQLRYAS